MSFSIAEVEPTARVVKLVPLWEGPLDSRVSWVSVRPASLIPALESTVLNVFLSPLKARAAGQGAHNLGAFKGQGLVKEVVGNSDSPEYLRTLQGISGQSETQAKGEHAHSWD